MKRIELIVEHSYKNRFMGRHQIHSDGGMVTFGSSRESTVRLLGDSVSGIHATVEWTGENWLLSDLSGEFGTWIQKKPVVQQAILETTLVNIGQHQLKLTPVVLQFQLFHNEKSETLDSVGEIYHQVVVKKFGLLADNTLLKFDQKFEFQYEGKTESLQAPKSHEWSVHHFGHIEIRQRLVKGNTLKQSPKERWVQSLDPSLKAPMIFALTLFVLFGALLIFAPKAPKDSMTEIKPEDQNQYTRMIYDGAKTKKAKAESQKLTQKMGAKAPTQAQNQAPAVQPNQKVSAAAAKVVNNIKASGLSALIGKISARAAKSGTFIQSAGVAPSVSGSGMALSAGRTIGSTAPNQVGIAAGEGHKIGAVGTSGKGGGSGDYKGFGGLAVGGVGTATVGTVDDETEVDGGLDKDVIARYIKTQLGQIRYCYERQLSANPDLYGKVMVKFTIGSTGTVASQQIGNTSMNNPMVEGCILRRVAAWQFPAPKGGTQVIVSYPFLFKSTK